jgi:hypothetical protein
MTDRKSAATRRKRSGKKVRGRPRVSFSPLAPFGYLSSWTAPGLSSNSSGVIISTIGASISSSFEYTTLQALYTEVRLVKLQMTLSPIQSTNTAVSHGRIRIGTNILMNSTTYTAPTGYSSVDNTSKVRTALTYMVRPMVYNMVVPRGLDYSNLVSDAPATVTPWAGSPGVIQIYGGGLNVSTNYFFVDIKAWYHLRGRQ